tara:strand:- start:469 stop:963 length:495 start_codon:yes stop_codon:yes gene_type:complete
MGNLGTIRIGSSEHGASSYLTLVNAATTGSMYEQNRILKDFHFIDDKARLHTENLKNGAINNKLDNIKWNKSITNSSTPQLTTKQLLLNDQKIFRSLMIQPITVKLEMMISNIASASTVYMCLKPLGKPNKKRKKKDEQKESDHHVSEKDNVSLLIYWEFNSKK